MPLILAALIIVLFVLIIGWIQDAMHLRRASKLQARAETLGLHPAGDGAAHSVMADASHFLLFALGRRGEVKRAVKGAFPRGAAMVETLVFEYNFNTPLGRYVRTWRQTVVQISSRELSLPGFGIIPDAVFDQMVESIRDAEILELVQGTAGVTFKGHTAFNQMMHVQGPDRARIRTLIDDPLLHFFEGGGDQLPHYDLCVEVAGNKVLVYRYDKEATPAELEPLLNSAFEVYDLLVAASGREKGQSL